MGNKLASELQMVTCDQLLRSTQLSSLQCTGAFTIWAKLAAAVRNNLVFYAVLTVGPPPDTSPHTISIGIPVML